MFSLFPFLSDIAKVSVEQCEERYKELKKTDFKNCSLLHFECTPLLQHEQTRHELNHSPAPSPVKMGPKKILSGSAKNTPPLKSTTEL